MRKGGVIFCDAKFCNLRISSQDPERVSRPEGDFHGSCWKKVLWKTNRKEEKKVFRITIIQARWKEASNGKHKPRDLLKEEE